MKFDLKIQFSVEQKSFTLIFELGFHHDLLRIIECGRRINGSIDLAGDEIGWFAETGTALIGRVFNGEPTEWRKRESGGKTLSVTAKKNKCGRFIHLVEVTKDRRTDLMLPEGRDSLGWRRVFRALGRSLPVRHHRAVGGGVGGPKSRWIPKGRMESVTAVMVESGTLAVASGSGSGEGPSGGSPATTGVTGRMLTEVGLSGWALKRRSGSTGKLKSVGFVGEDLKVGWSSGLGGEQGSGSVGRASGLVGKGGLGAGVGVGDPGGPFLGGPKTTYNGALVGSNWVRVLTGLELVYAGSGLGDATQEGSEVSPNHSGLGGVGLGELGFDGGGTPHRKVVGGGEADDEGDVGGAGQGGAGAGQGVACAVSGSFLASGGGGERGSGGEAGGEEGVREEIVLGVGGGEVRVREFGGGGGGGRDPGPGVEKRGSALADLVAVGGGGAGGGGGEPSVSDAEVVEESGGGGCSVSDEAGGGVGCGDGGSGGGGSIGGGGGAGAGGGGVSGSGGGGCASFGEGTKGDCEVSGEECEPASSVKPVRARFQYPPLHYIRRVEPPKAKVKIRSRLINERKRLHWGMKD